MSLITPKFLEVVMNFINNNISNMISSMSILTIYNKKNWKSKKLSKRRKVAAQEKVKVIGMKISSRSDYIHVHKYILKQDLNWI